MEETRVAILAINPTRSPLMFSTIDVMVAQAHIDQLNEILHE